jgi:predicted nuclease of predicted toxin-antitoxin system
MTLRLLFDEQTSKEAASRLSEHFDVERVVTVSELGPGADDDEIWPYAVEHDRTVVTEDPHFLDGEADPGDGTYPGVIFWSCLKAV